MKVYLVSTYYYDSEEGAHTTPLSVWTTKELAEKEITRLKKDKKNRWDDFEIDEFELDREED